MHDTPVVEDDEIALLPPMSVYILGGVNSTLKAVTDIADLVKVIDCRNDPSLRIFGPKSQNATT